jgi:hypothetical protein
LKIDVELLEVWLNDSLSEIIEKDLSTHPEIFNRDYGKVEAYEDVLNFLRDYKNYIKN